MLLDLARRKLSEGEPRAALETLGKHTRRFPHGKLVEERDALLVNALVLAGEFAGAREDRLVSCALSHELSLPLGRSGSGDPPAMTRAFAAVAVALSTVLASASNARAAVSSRLTFRAWEGPQWPVPMSAPFRAAVKERLGYDPFFPGHRKSSRSRSSRPTAGCAGDFASSTPKGLSVVRVNSRARGASARNS